MTIRDMKDIPMVNVSINIPQPDFTDEERDYYIEELAKKSAEMMGYYITEDGHMRQKKPEGF